MYNRQSITNRNNVAYRDMGNLLRKRVSFNSHSVTARMTETVIRGNNVKVYSVFSYTTLIFEEIVGFPYMEKQVYFNNSFFSMTTRRIQGILSRSIVPDSFPFTYRGPRGGVHSYDGGALLYAGRWYKPDDDGKYFVSHCGIGLRVCAEFRYNDVA